MDGGSLEELIFDVLGPPPARGRRKRDLQAVVVRDLEEKDILKLNAMKDGDLKAQPRPLQKLRHTHHMLAKLVADGVREEECSANTGYDICYISSLKRDPAFANLVKYYAEQKQEIYLDVHQRLSSLSLDSVEELQDRLATDPGSFTNREMMELAELALDRSGAGPTSHVKTTVALISPELMTRIKSEVERRQVGNIRTLNPQGNQSTPVGRVIEHSALAESEAPRLQSAGDHVSEEVRPTLEGEVQK